MVVVFFFSSFVLFLVSCEKFATVFLCSSFSSFNFPIPQYYWSTFGRVKYFLIFQWLRWAKSFSHTSFQEFSFNDFSFLNWNWGDAKSEHKCNKCWIFFVFTPISLTFFITLCITVGGGNRKLDPTSSPEFFTHFFFSFEKFTT